ncbi:MAG: phage virion morphogenesis protein, partial [Acinetobacter sp.]
RKFRLRDKKNKIKNKMFNLIKNAKYRRFERTAQGIAIGFAGRVAFIARVHQYGLRDKVEKDGPTVQYASRELLGFTVEEMDMIETEVLKFISK